MKQFKRINYNNVNKSEYYLHYETVDMCPICKAKIAPVYIACSLDSPDSASVFDFCRNCNNTFVTKYAVHYTEKLHSGLYYFEENSIIYSEPTLSIKKSNVQV